MINHWLGLVSKVSTMPVMLITGVRKIVENVTFTIPVSCLYSPSPDFTDICYTKSKFTQLNRVYWDSEGVDAAVEKLTGRKDKPHTSVSIQLRSGEKDSRSQGFCMQNMVITQVGSYSVVDVYYRSTEVLQKFLADLIFFKRVLPDVFNRMKIEPKEIRFHFANVYLSAVFMPIFVRYSSDPVEFFKQLEQSDPKFHRTCGLSVSKFLKETHNYTYRTRVKMFEYFKEYVDPKKTLAITKYMKVKGLLTSTEELPEDEE